jgi:hypothetical protein
MKIQLLILILLYACVACKKGEKKEMFQKEESISLNLQDSTINTTADSVSYNLNSDEDINGTTLKSFNTALVLKNFKKEAKMLEKSNISLPDDFSKTDFLDNSNGVGLDIDLIVGNIVRLKYKKDGNSIFENTGISTLKPNLNLKPKPEKDNIFYEENFNSNYSIALSAIIGGVSTDKKYAYTLQLIKLNNIIINSSNLDQEILKNEVKKKAKNDLKDLYIIIGATNWYLRASQYEESNLKGNFSYAINIGGQKYASTSSKRIDYKIGINAQPISNFIKID